MRHSSAAPLRLGATRARRSLYRAAGTRPFAPSPPQDPSDSPSGPLMSDSDAHVVIGDPDL